MNKLILTSLFALTAASVTPVYAQVHYTQKDSAALMRTVDLGPVVVTGSGHHQHLRSSATPVHVISQDDIRKTGITNFQDVITNMMPQLSIAPNSMGAFLRMNGLGNKYILILLNGKKVIGDISGNIDLNRINTSRIRRIEVLDGAASSLYGSDAIGGVINIITDQPSEEILSVTSKTRVSGKGQITQSVNLDIFKDRFGSYTSFTHDEAESYRINDYEYKKGNDGDTQRSLAPLYTGYYSNVINQQFTYTPIDRLSLKLDGTYAWKRTWRPDTRKDITGGYDYELRSESWRGNLGAVYKLSKKNSLQLDLVSDNYGYGYEYEVATKSNAIGDYVQKKNQQRYEAELKGIFELYKNSTTIFGADWRNDFLNAATGNVNNHVYTWAGYAQHETVLLPNVKASLGLRYTYNESFGSNLTPKATLMYTPGKFIFRASYSRGYRAPGLDELFYHYNTYLRGYSTITIGNKNLDPEKSNYFSLGAEYNTRVFTIGVTGYLNYINDMIIKNVVDVDAPTLAYLRTEFPEITNAQAAKIDHYNLYTNSDKGRVYGVQVNASVNLLKGLSITANYAYTYARTLTDGVWENLERSIKNTATIMANYTHQWGKYTLNANVNGRLQGKTYYTSKYENAPGYGIWNINTTHTFDCLHWLLIEPSIGIDNVFNKKDNRIDSSMRRYALYSPGRMVVLGLALKLK